MIDMNLGANGPRRLLCIGAHADDIEIGCGATVLSLIAKYPRLDVVWAVLSGDERRRTEARNSAALLLDLERKPENKILCGAFRDSFFPYDGGEIKTYFRDELANIEPDLVLTHSREDRHQDHRLVSELTWNTFRSHLIWEYEIPKYDGLVDLPNCYFAVKPTIVEKKVDYIMSSFASQGGKTWFDEETFRGLLRLRGVEAGVKYAEAFVARKITMS